MRQLKSKRFSRVFPEYLKNCLTDFDQTNVIFRQSPIVCFEIKRLRQVIHCCHGNQSMMECCAKNHDLREEKWHFLKISN